MLTTKLVLLGMPTMLRQLLVRIVDQVPDLDIVAELPDDNLRSPRIMETPADVVVVDSDQAPMDAVVALLRSQCQTRILGLSSDGSRAFLHELRPHRVPLGELSPAALLEVIRKGEPRPTPAWEGGGD
jgi:chemotaxis response regulator CheB